MQFTRVESKGSFWLLDDGLNQYCRMPKWEQPREFFNDAALRDFVWLPMEGWHITTERVFARWHEFYVYYDPPTLVIKLEHSNIYAPQASLWEKVV